MIALPLRVFVKQRSGSSAIALLYAAAVICTAQVAITEYTLPTPLSDPCGIAAGPDGNVWFTEDCGLLSGIFGNRIGKITTAGVITEFSLPDPGSGPMGITAGPDGNMWVTEWRSNKIAKVTTAGVITEFSLPNPFPG
ncbi:MAG TPA: hypothetical protein VNH18_19165, partial [Bryobacteraceae bacterium]|nr:hypothetical protein [Bryobacteraceae bacterium]